MEKQTTRLEAFSDGIFGVAITLLALEIGIQEYECNMTKQLHMYNYMIMNNNISRI